MRITPDTNVLLRAAVGDDPVQSPIAARALLGAERVAVATASLCEFAWVLMRGYKRNAHEVAGAIRALIDSETVEADRPAVEAGLAVLEAGGDFADGVIAFEGRRAGGVVFTSFDRDAVRKVKQTGGEAKLLSSHR